MIKKSFDICVDGGGCFVKWNVYEFKKGKRIIVDIEMEKETAPNNEQRKIRRKFCKLRQN